MLVRRFRALTLVAALFTVAASVPAAQSQSKAPAITTPKQQFGFNIGDDYQLATYTQFSEYWRKLDQESNRMQVIEIGMTEEGKPHLAAIVTAPENFAKLDRYKQGYTFTMTGTVLAGAPATCNGRPPGSVAPGYALFADPLDPVGNPHFFGTNADGTLYQHHSTLSDDMSESGPPSAGIPVKY